jgi:hypothetical protein
MKTLDELDAIEGLEGLDGAGYPDCELGELDEGADAVSQELDLLVRCVDAARRCGAWNGRRGHGRAHPERVRRPAAKPPGTTRLLRSLGRGRRADCRPARAFLLLSHLR